MIIKIIKDFRTFKKGDVFDLSLLDTLQVVTIVGDNGSGKSSLIHALRGYKNDHMTNSLYNSDFKDLSDNIEVEHKYEKMFYLDNIKDNGRDLMVSFDAVEYLNSGGFQTKNLSHGQGTLAYLAKFVKQFEKKIVPNKTLLVFDEVDNGLSSQNMPKIINFVNNMAHMHKCHILIISHNPFLISQSIMCYNINTKSFVSANDYIEEQTGFSLTKKEA